MSNSDPTFSAPPPVPQPAPKKGLSCLAMTGIGCLVLVVLGLVGGGALVAKFMPQLKEFAEDAKKNPNKAAAKLILNVMPGFQMVRDEEDKQQFVFTVSGTTEEFTMNYADAKDGKGLVIRNSKGEEVSIENKNGVVTVTPVGNSADATEPAPAPAPPPVPAPPAPPAPPK